MLLQPDESMTPKMEISNNKIQMYHTNSSLNDSSLVQNISKVIGDPHQGMLQCLNLSFYVLHILLCSYILL